MKTKRIRSPRRFSKRKIIPWNQAILSQLPQFETSLPNGGEPTCCTAARLYIHANYIKPPAVIKVWIVSRQRYLNFVWLNRGLFSYVYVAENPLAFREIREFELPKGGDEKTPIES